MLLSVWMIRLGILPVMNSCLFLSNVYQLKDDVWTEDHRSRRWVGGN